MRGTDILICTGFDGDTKEGALNFFLWIRDFQKYSMHKIHGERRAQSMI